MNNISCLRRLIWYKLVGGGGGFAIRSRTNRTNRVGGKFKNVFRGRICKWQKTNKKKTIYVPKTLYRYYSTSVHYPVRFNDVKIHTVHLVFFSNVLLSLSPPLQNPIKPRRSRAWVYRSRRRGSVSARDMLPRVDFPPGHRRNRLIRF